MIVGMVQLAGLNIDRSRFLAAFELLGSSHNDYSETHFDGPVAVGRHMLAVSPAGRNDTLTGRSHDPLIVADAVLDNRDEVGSKLGLSQQDLAEASDTDLIRLSFLAWGKECVNHLVGDYAFAVVRKDPPEIILIRDHIGSRPLYWTVRDQTLHFGTLIPALVLQSDQAWRIDERVVSEYLLCPLLPVSRPFFRELNSVPPGSMAVIKEGEARTERWWRPPLGLERPKRPSREAVAQCRELLERAVSDRIESSQPVGTHLSGGIDSTGVAVIAARTLRTHGRSLAGAYPWSPPPSDLYPLEHDGDERRRILRIAEAERLPLRYTAGDLNTLTRFVHRPIELEGDADLADEVPVLEAASRDGVRVMLSGWGGDEAFSSHGRGHVLWLLLAGRLEAASRFARSSRGSLRSLSAIRAVLWEDVLQPLLPVGLTRLRSPRKRYMIHNSFMSRDLYSQYCSIRHDREPDLGFTNDAARNAWRLLTAGHVTMRMETWAAHSAEYGIQYRYPLTDRRLLEHLLTLDPTELYLDEKPRGLARAVLSDCVPRSASKLDLVNERYRSDARETFWRSLATQVERGEFKEDCPWLDMASFRQHALSPREQTSHANIAMFAELFAANRMYALYQRAARNSWL